ncbi:MAG TPA: sulfate adenylyltransferase subunit CysD [Nitrospirae bacterium]|nr:sulfate adenylyltransferase subunit CysD [Nitrospirota bacterium]
MERYRLSALKTLEAESIYIIREVAAEFQNPALLYSVGKDCSVLASLARKAFYPGKIPFPFLHIDTTRKFPDMHDFRDRICKEMGVGLIVHEDDNALSQETSLDDLSGVRCHSALKTEALLTAIHEHGFDAAIGGARREEEESRSKKCVYSFRDQFGQMESEGQRHEIWNLYNSRINQGESIQVSPISNWAELDIWHYIHMESIPVAPFYFARERLVKPDDTNLIPIYDQTQVGIDGAITALCRFPTLERRYCAVAVRSEAVSARQIIEEIVTRRRSETGARTAGRHRDPSIENNKKEDRI